jgi:hypothetical protein
VEFDKSMSNLNKLIN